MTHHIAGVARRLGYVALLAGVALAVIFMISRYKVTVVNMVPSDLALEEDQNPEPSIAVNPADPLEIIGAPLFMGHESAGCSAESFGILRSVDAGKTWALHCTMELGAAYWMGDPSVAFHGDGSKVIVAAQRFDDFTHEARIFEVKPSTGSSWPVVDLVSPANTFLESSHVPWVATSPSATSSLFAVGMDSYNSVAGCNTGVVWSNLISSTVTRTCVAERDPLDGSVWTPVVKTAIAEDGTIYAATYRMPKTPTVVTTAPSYWKAQLDVVVFRHDPSIAAANAFRDLSDDPASGDPCTGGDGEVGYRIARCVAVPHSNAAVFGGERRTYTHVAVAVSPGESKHVVAAWGDTAGPTVGMTLRIRESVDGGKTWGASYSVPRSLNPALAINKSGTVAFAWQHLTQGPAQRWKTQVALFARGKVEAGPHSTFTLSDHRADLPAPCIVPYIGDYIDLKSVGTTFYGAFSASSDLDPANFPRGIHYLRDKHVGAGTSCPIAGSGNGEPELTVDPYFFSVSPRFLVDRAWLLAEWLKFLFS